MQLAGGTGYPVLRRWWQVSFGPNQNLNLVLDWSLLPRNLEVTELLCRVSSRDSRIRVLDFMMSIEGQSSGGPFGPWEKKWVRWENMGGIPCCSNTNWGGPFTGTWYSSRGRRLEWVYVKVERCRGRTWLDMEMGKWENRKRERLPY